MALSVFRSLNSSQKNWGGEVEEKEGTKKITFSQKHEETLSLENKSG